jgi:AcrR family transcriptional regulator
MSSPTADNATADSDAKPRRTDRRRVVTRGRLLEAARVLFAEKGVDAVRVNEITEQADLGFGSFYTYFASKDEIVEAVVSEIVATQGGVIDELTRDLDDVAEIVATAHCYWMDLACSDPIWGWLLVRLDVSHRVLFETLGSYAVRDMRRGVAEGRFEVPSETVALTAAGGALIANMRAVLEGAASPDVGLRHAECVLRIYGLTKAEARKVAVRVEKGAARRAASGLSR